MEKIDKRKIKYIAGFGGIVGLSRYLVGIADIILDTGFA